MRGLFDLENPVLNFIKKLTYSAWLNLLWTVCCIPIVTAGAATTALYYTSMRLVKDEDIGLTKAFFRSFRENFKQATVIWLILFAVGAFLAVDGYVVSRLMSTSAFWTIVAAILIGAAILYVTVCLYIFPLLSRYDNTTAAMFKNSVAMGLRYLFCTILMALIYFAMAWFAINVFTPAIVFGTGTCAFLCCYLLRRIFPREESAEENGEEA